MNRGFKHMHHAHYNKRHRCFPPSLNASRCTSPDSSNFRDSFYGSLRRNRTKPPIIKPASFFTFLKVPAHHLHPAPPPHRPAHPQAVRLPRSQVNPVATVHLFGSQANPAVHPSGNRASPAATVHLFGSQVNLASPSQAVPGLIHPFLLATSRLSSQALLLASDP